MYLASSVFVRHTLNALYADLKVTLNKVALDAHGEPRKNREKSLFVGLTASGIARVSGAVGEWEVYVISLSFILDFRVHGMMG